MLGLKSTTRFQSTRRRGRASCAALLSLLLTAAAAPAAAGADSVFIDDLTWTELRDRVNAGSTTALVPIGATEQSGPHMVLGKHNVRVKALAGLIAKGLGHSLVAPVMAYVPEGGIDPATAHMRYPGTITIPDAVFEAVLDSTARSLCLHGFRDVVFLGDHGGYQASEQRVVARLNKAWAGKACRAHAPPEYYRAAAAGYGQWLAGRGFSREEIGTHAGLADTALAMGVDPSLVRTDQLAAAGKGAPGNGVAGDPRRATADLGRAGIEQVVEHTVTALKGALAAR